MTDDDYDPYLPYPHWWSLSEPGRVYPYSRLWYFRRWKRRRKIKIDYPGFFDAVIRREAW